VLEVTVAAGCSEVSQSGAVRTNKHWLARHQRCASMQIQTHPLSAAGTAHEPPSTTPEGQAGVGVGSHTQVPPAHLPLAYWQALVQSLTWKDPPQPSSLPPIEQLAPGATLPLSGQSGAALGSHTQVPEAHLPLAYWQALVQSLTWKDPPQPSSLPPMEQLAPGATLPLSGQSGAALRSHLQTPSTQLALVPLHARGQLTAA
jgi:mRNA-degrading endonuclease HigB of HigAB toxin-antitoxin module